MTIQDAKIVWMSDLHFVADGLVLGHDPRLRVESAVAYVNAHHPDADLCVISGDLVDRGTLQDYTILRNCLDALVVPYRVMVGNHDSRGELRQIFDLPRGAMDDFVQYALPLPAGRVFCLDTLNLDADCGQFCAARLDWLERALADAPLQPVLVFMHHPPLALGLPMQDTDRLTDGAAVLKCLSSHEGPVHLFFGHVHRVTCGVVAGMPFATMRSVLYQAPGPRPEWDWNSFSPTSEAPNIGVINVSGADIILHYEQFCAAEYGVE